jgi:zinc/manganese transport system permease protein
MSGADLDVIWQVMKWPLAACLLLPPLLVYLGIHVVKREVIFVDLALAQVATLGTCVALILGYHFEDRAAFWISLAVTFAAAALFSWSRSTEEQPVPQEAIIGITFVVAAAAVIILLSRVAGGKEELEHLLTGDILNVTGREVWQRAALFAALAAFYATFHRRFSLISTNARLAFAEGLNVRLWDFLFYAAFAVIVVSFVRVAGVLLTFAYLIVPAVCGVMLTDGWRERLVIGWGIAATTSLVGLWASYQFDLPTGAAVVCACGVALIIVSIIASARRSTRPPAGVVVLEGATVSGARYPVEGPTHVSREH